MKCDELKKYKAYEFGTSYVYHIEEVNAAIDELKKKLMPCLNGDCILTCEVVEKYGKENAELKQKLESVQASDYAESVDAGMRERRLKRELWLARAYGAESEARGWYHSTGYCVKYDGYHTIKGALNGKGLLRLPEEWMRKWLNVERKCLKMAEKYK